MGASLLQAVAALMSTCTRRLQRAARRMGGKPGAVAPWRKAFSLPTGKGKAAAEEEEGGLWRKEILMGERCQPLEFSGVIYYDADGHRLTQPPRSPMRSPLPASFKLAANAGVY
ncbi:hypothetical protein D1007_54008 [Hordeum vulgare]|uniref:Predicted protein n=1 Tax=Hordeum vulgare subsp. vulgare TaxID=112509 RepID=F2DUA9_HORVV|nr:uncharacterized protein LOC123410440 [Hordeum vulgare subsp. vulgare]KAE8773703.1 hypothetical protein D1007_54008 [Hordeum vulgare]KAI4975328.1 hypothetical protein ZWY2020_048935 [Hordeum vulgare]BAJ98680.1 predicted protein [Hordeum vulgare subsp. vulgare]